MISISIHKVRLTWYFATTMWYLAAWYCIGLPKQFWTVRIWTADTIKILWGLWGGGLCSIHDFEPSHECWIGLGGLESWVVRLKFGIVYTWIIMFREDALQQDDHGYSMYIINNLSTFNKPSELARSIKFQLWQHQLTTYFYICSHDLGFLSCFCNLPVTFSEKWNYKPRNIVPNNPRNHNCHLLW